MKNKRLMVDRKRISYKNNNINNNKHRNTLVTLVTINELTCKEDLKKGLVLALLELLFVTHNWESLISVCIWRENRVWEESEQGMECRRCWSQKAYCKGITSNNIAVQRAEICRKLSPFVYYNLAFCSSMG